MQITQSVKIFQQTIVRSLSDLNFYAEILNAPVRFSLKVVVIFYLLLGVILTGIFTFKEIPVMRATIDSARSELVANYPQSLTFDWQNHQLTSNATQPIEVSFPSRMKPLSSAPKNLAIIDTSIDDAPENANSLLYVTRSKLFVNSMQGNWTETELSNLIESESIHLDRNALIDLTESSKNFENEILGILPWFALLFFSVGTLILRLGSTLLNALIVQLLFQILHKPLSYKKVFQLCLHVLIPAELIYQLSNLLFPSLDVPMFGLAFWLIITLIIWHLRHLQVLRVVVDKDEKSKKK